jgi:putative mRNA 3-end processing factor
MRLDDDCTISTLSYGEVIDINGVQVSLHPAGHILGSAQVRLEHQGKIWVVSGDYKLDSDPTCEPFEPIRCHIFISECTFGLPVYRWPDPQDVFTEILSWWQGNQALGQASLLFGYALGKSQRLLAGLAAIASEHGALLGPIYTHGATENVNQAYRSAGVALPETIYAMEAEAGVRWADALIVAPPTAHGTSWTRRFGRSSAAFASGWMQIRGHRRRRAIDRGFVLSDHADWPGLLQAIQATRAETIWLTHGYTAVGARWFSAQGKHAIAIETRYEGERNDATQADETPNMKLSEPENS